MLLTGGLANSCLKSLGLNVGESLTSDDAETLTRVKEMLKEYNKKIVLPFDAIVGKKYDDNYVAKIMIKVRDENKYYTKPYEYLDGKRSYFDPIFEKTNNPINWINAWTNSESLQVAPQESEIESYNKAAVNNDLGDSDFGDFNF